MIWFRRIVAIPLILIALLLFIAALLLTELNSTVTNPRFYKEQLAHADIYNFVYDEALPAGLDELETDTSSDLPIEVADFKSEIISAAKKTLPPDWLQTQVELAIEALIPYFRGSTDEFNYTILFKDRVESGAQVIKDDFLHGETATRLYNNLMEYAAEQVIKNLGNVPYVISLNETQVENALRTIFTQEWMTSQISTVIGNITPYITSDSDQFKITIQVRELVDPMADAIIDLLATQQTYDYLLEQIIMHTVDKYLGDDIDLPFEVSLSQEEISSTIKQVLPQSWEHDRFVDIVKAFAAYVKGAETISVNINLTDSKAAVSDVLTALADQKLQAIFNTLPEVSMTDFLQAIKNLPPGSLPDVRPVGVTYEQFKDDINLDITYWINQMVTDQIPDQWSFTKDDLITAMGTDREDFLDEARDWVSQGWTFTDVDLKDQLTADDQKTLDDVRHYIASGYTITEVDLKDKITEGGGNINDIDQARDIINTVRTWLWVLWLVPLILLLCAGLLIARSLKGKLLWFLGMLFVIFLIFYIASGVGYSHFGEPAIQRVLPDPADYQGIESVMIDKGNEMANNAIDTFFSGIRSMALYTMIGSGVVFLGIIVWSMIKRDRQASPKQATLPQTDMKSVDYEPH